MGLSSSQARLLTITARLTSNEYESQQISNAKMRLATQSEQASADYIAALNTTKLMYSNYDAKGDAVFDALTANTLYQYSDLKNQYALVNSAGQVMVSSLDAARYEKSDNLADFLEAYGVKKVLKEAATQKSYIHTENNVSTNVSIEELHDELQAKEGYLETWETKINEFKQSKETEVFTYGTWDPIAYEWSEPKKDKGSPNNEYFTEVKTEDTTIIGDNGKESKEQIVTLTTNDPYEKYQFYKAMAQLYYSRANESLQIVQQGDYLGHVDEDNLEKVKKQLQNAQLACISTASYDTWIQTQCAYTDYTQTAMTEEYKNAEEYFRLRDEYNAALENAGYSTFEDAYEYSDPTKARWYTNLWYKLNGDSTEKSSNPNTAKNYAVLDSKLASSAQWLQDSLTQGIITLEAASYTDISNVVPDKDRPFKLQLKGIKWNSMIYSNCVDITEQDDTKAIAKAEAEYQRRNNEINAGDQKYENKIKQLDTEHQALQTEYDSVQSAMNKNIERSFKAFS